MILKYKGDYIVHAFKFTGRNLTKIRRMISSHKLKFNVYPRYGSEFRTYYLDNGYVGWELKAGDYLVVSEYGVKVMDEAELKEKFEIIEEEG